MVPRPPKRNEGRIVPISLGGAFLMPPGLGRVWVCPLPQRDTNAQEEDLQSNQPCEICVNALGGRDKPGHFPGPHASDRAESCPAIDILIGFSEVYWEHIPDSGKVATVRLTSISAHPKPASL